MTHITAILLIRNEDRFIDRVLHNIEGFCDRIVVADNQSDDQTPEILLARRARCPKIEIHRIRRPSDSHALIAPLAGTDSWVFGVDGDEIYDPAGLARLRQELVNGVHDRWWRIRGNVLNCDELTDGESRASGYLAPPCRTMTKLYNFGAIESWSGRCPQRLHGGEVRFRPGYAEGLSLDLHERLSWDQSPFRCLHAVFLPRSSRRHGDAATRWNVTESQRWGPIYWLRQAIRSARGIAPESEYKFEKYRRGSRVTVDAGAFFPSDTAG